MARGRREKEIDNTTGAAAEFAQDLRNTRREAGNPPYRDMACDAHYSPTALSVAASGKRLPTWHVTEAYLRACKVTDIEPWKERWDIARARVCAAKGNGRSGRRGIPHAVVLAPEDNRSGGDPHTAELRKQLDELRIQKRLPLRTVAAKSREIQARAKEAGRQTRALSSTTIHEVLSGRRPIDHAFVELYLMAIEAKQDEQEQVGEAVGRIRSRAPSLHTRLQLARRAKPVNIELPQRKPMTALEAEAPTAVFQTRWIGRAKVPHGSATQTLATPRQTAFDTFVWRGDVSATAPLAAGPSAMSLAQTWWLLPPVPFAPDVIQQPSPAGPYPGLRLETASFAQANECQMADRELGARVSHSDWMVRAASSSNEAERPSGPPNGRNEGAERCMVRRHRTCLGYYGQPTPGKLRWPIILRLEYLMLLVALIPAALGIASLLGRGFRQLSRLVADLLVSQTAPIPSSDLAAYGLIVVGGLVLVLDIAALTWLLTDRIPTTIAEPNSKSLWHAYFYSGRHTARRSRHGSVRTMPPGQLRGHHQPALQGGW